MLSWLNTSVGTHKLYLAYEYEQYKTMRDIKRDRTKRQWIKRKHEDMFRDSSHSLRRRLHTEGFLLRPHRSFHKGTFTEELQSQHREHTTPLSIQTPLHKREGTKPSTK